MSKLFDSHFGYMMNGAQRGYKKPGAKLLPRDAAECQYGKSAKARRKAIALERKHHEEAERAYMESLGYSHSAAEARVVRARMALSTRRANRVEKLFDEMVTSDHSKVIYDAAFLMLGNAQWRYFSAIDNDWSARMAEEADDQLLSYARG